MAEYIEREEAIRVASGYCHPANIAAELANLPAADVRPVAMGKWIDERYDDEELVGGWYTIPKCSACEEEAPFKSNYCPNCGADMRGEQT